jgi:hypothetical protein
MDLRRIHLTIDKLVLHGSSVEALAGLTSALERSLPALLSDPAREPSRDASAPMQIARAIAAAPALQEQLTSWRAESGPAR